MITIEELIQTLVDRKGSDLHITIGSPPRCRIDGELVAIDGQTLGPEETQKMIYGLLTSDQIARFEKELELDFSFGLQGLGRFRTNVFRQRGAVGAVLRVIPAQVIAIEKLGLPLKVVKEICELPKGLVLVTGATGSGKSTTLASMLDYINRTRQEHVITVEDPIEFVHENKKCLFNQREVGHDTHSFPKALRTVLRQDPDVVLIGEMRDLETIESALTIAETGHLTFATLHTSDAAQSLNRVIDVFPPHQQAQVRTQLSFVLQAVICQQLMPHASGRGRVLGAEVMIITAGIRSLIREGKIHQVYSLIQTGGGLGMRTMNQAVAELIKAGSVKLDEALATTPDPEDLKRILKLV